MRPCLWALALLSACTAETGLLLGPPASFDGGGVDGTSTDLGPSPGDRGPRDRGDVDGGTGPNPADGGWAVEDGGRADGGVEACEPWNDVVLGTGARTDVPPHLTVFVGEAAVSWQTPLGIRGVVVDAQGQVRLRLDLGHPSAKDPYLFHMGFELHAIFTESVGDRSFIRRVVVDGLETSIDLGEVAPTRIAVERIPDGTVMVAAVSPTVSTLEQLVDPGVRFGVQLDPSWSVPPVAEPYPPFSMHMSSGGRFLAAWDEAGITFSTINLSGSGGRELISPPAGLSFFPGFVVTWSPPAFNHLGHGLAAAVPGPDSGAISVLHYRFPLYTSQTAPTVIAQGQSTAVGFSISSAWAPELGAKLFAWPDASDTPFGGGTTPRRQIFLAGLNEVDDPYPAPGAIPPRRVSEAPSGNALYPSLGWVGDRAAIVYLTDTGEVRLTRGRPCAPR
jgi:hypothetical protein